LWRLWSTFEVKRLRVEIKVADLRNLMSIISLYLKGTALGSKELG
jgi:hypothetical protein